MVRRGVTALHAPHALHCSLASHLTHVDMCMVCGTCHMALQQGGHQERPNAQGAVHHGSERGLWGLPVDCQWHQAHTARP
jgi:hypothetical protein